MPVSSYIRNFLFLRSVCALCQNQATDCKERSTSDAISLVQQRASVAKHVKTTEAAPMRIDELDSSDAVSLSTLNSAFYPESLELIARADQYDPTMDPPLPGHYKVSFDSYDLGGFRCGKQEPTVDIWYPTDLHKGPFPIASFGHSIEGQVVPNMIEAVVSLGFIVVSSATSGGVCNGYLWQDMLHAIRGSKDQVKKHKALQYVDWNRTAVFGHSMGGYSAMIAASQQDEVQNLNIKAVVASHGCFDDPSPAVNISIPAMFTRASFERHVRTQFDLCKGRPKILALVTNATHKEPQATGHLNPFTAHFLACHVADLRSSCDKLYGKSADTLCQANPMDECEIVHEGTPQNCSDEMTTEGWCERQKAAGNCDRRITLLCQRTCDFGC